MGAAELRCSDLVIDALEMATTRAKPTTCWSLLTNMRASAACNISIRYTERLAEAGVVNSVGSRGDSYDREDPALAESFTGLYKTELIFHEGTWKNADDVEWATLTYVDWLNHRRIHNEIGTIPSAELEADYYRRTQPVELAASQQPSPYETRADSTLFFKLLQTETDDVFVTPRLVGPAHPKMGRRR